MPGQRRSSSTSNGTRGKNLSAADAVRRAREQIEALLGRETETISSFAPDGTKGWVVTVEVVELERIPPTTSMLGSYQVKLDRDGELVEARRVRRYARNQADRQEEADE
jgi:gas vesicle protein GvpO